MIYNNNGLKNTKKMYRTSYYICAVMNVCFPGKREHVSHISLFKKSIGEGEQKQLNREEKDAWYRILEKRNLAPLLTDNETIKKQNEIAAELKNLRNRVFFGFFSINVVYVALVYTLTEVDSNRSLLSTTITCSASQSTEISPISIVFTLTFGIILLFQFFGMLYHRLSTYAKFFVRTQVPKRDEQEEKIHPDVTDLYEKEEVREIRKEEENENREKKRKTVRFEDNIKTYALMQKFISKAKKNKGDEIKDFSRTWHAGSSSTNTD